MKDKLKEIGSSIKDKAQGAYRTLADNLPGKGKPLTSEEAEKLTKKALKDSEKKEKKAPPTKYSKEELRTFWADEVEPDIRLHAADGDRSVIVPCPSEMQHALYRYGKKQGWKVSKWGKIGLHVKWGNRFTTMSVRQKMTLFIFLMINLAILVHYFISNGTI